MAGPIRAQGPDGTTFEFPEGTDEAVISRTIKSHYAPSPPQPTAPSRTIPQRQANVAPPRPADNIFEAVGNAVTQWGDTRTQAQRGVGEVLTQSIPIETPAQIGRPETWLDDFGRSAAVGWGLFWNRSERDRAAIIKKNVPTSEFRRDEYGHLQVRFRADRPWAYINKPGGSLQDVQGFANDVVKFGPAARAGLAAQGAARGAGATGLVSAGAGATTAGGASAATEAASRALSVPVGGSQATPGDVTAAGLGGAAGHVVGNVVAAGTRRLVMTPDERAAEIIGRRVAEGGIKATGRGGGQRTVRGDEALREVERRATRVRGFPGKTAETVAEVAGTPGQSMARAVANVPGPGKEIARNAMESRATGRLADDLSPIEGGTTGAPGSMNTGSISSRTLEQARGALTPDDPGAPTTFGEAADALDAQIRANAQTAYGAARRTPIDQNGARTLLPHMQNAPKGVLASAERQLADEVRAVKIQIDEGRVAGKAAEDLAEMGAYQRELEAAQAQIARIMAGEEPELSPLALEYFQKGLSQAESALAPAAGQRASPEFRQVTIVRENFNALADRVAPTLGAARTQYAQGQRVREAMEQGRKVFEMRPEEVTRFLNPVDARTGQTRQLSKEEFQGFMYGVLDEIEKKLQRNETVFVLQFMRNRGWQEALTRFLGKDAATALRSRLVREAGMQRFRNYTQTGSQTTPLAEDIKAMTEDQPGLDFLGDVARAGELQGPIARRAGEVYQRMRRPGIYNENTNRAVAERLYAPATKGNIGALLRDARSNRLFNDASVLQLNGLIARLKGLRANLQRELGTAPASARSRIKGAIAQVDELMARASGARAMAAGKQAAPGAGVAAASQGED